MSIFGWSYPPGCSGTPYDEAQISDITKYIERLPLGVASVYWNEDGELQEGIPGTVKYFDGSKDVECFEESYRTVGQIDWDDDLSDEQNFVAAAAKYAEINGESSVKKCRAAFHGYECPGYLYRMTYKYTDCGPSIGFKVRMIEEATDTDAGPNCEPFDRVVEKWFYCDDTYKLGTWDEMIDAGMEIISISVSSIVEGVDYDTETIEIEIDGKTPEQISKEFYAAVEEVDRQAKSIWNDTHGCETCRAHWIKEGLPNGETEFGCPVWAECPDCEGCGSMI